MKIELLPNGMIVFDNGRELNQMRPEQVEGVIIFPPDEFTARELENDRYRNWRVQVSGVGYIVFDAPSREDALRIKYTIDKAMGVEPPFKFVQGAAVPIIL